MRVELVPGGKAPQRMSDGAVGFDVFAREVELGFCFSDEVAHSQDGFAKIHLGFKLDCNGKHCIYNLSLPEIRKEGEVLSLKGSELLMNFAAMLLPRSGWGSKYGFRLKNTVGIIDPDYRGEVIMAAEFDDCPPELSQFAQSGCNGCGIGKETDYCKGCTLENSLFGQPRVGQMLMVPAYVGELVIVEKLDETGRGENGFGSTGA